MSMMTGYSLKVTVIVWLSIPVLTLTYFVDESQVGFNWCWLMLIFPLAMYLSSTARYYQLVSEAVISLQEQFCLLCAMQRQAGTEKQAIKRATIRFLLMGLMWSLTDARTSRHLAVCELCAAAYTIMVSRKWAEALCAVSYGSRTSCCCDMFVGRRGERHLHCNYVQRSRSPGSKILLWVTNERCGGALVSTVVDFPLGHGLFFMQFPCSPCVCMGSLHILQMNWET